MDLRRGISSLALAVLLAAPSVARADEGQEQSSHVVFGGSLSIGDSGWGTEAGHIAEVGGRVHPIPQLGVGVSYLHLGAANNEGADAFGFHALELNAAWHPVVGRWFDPFLRAGVLGVIDSSGYMNQEKTSLWGLEGMAGFDVVHLPFALGVHVRSGFTNETWAAAGLHLELRL